MRHLQDYHEYGASLEEVGAELNLTRERVRQIQNKALAKLKTRLVARGIDEEAVREHLASLVSPSDRGPWL